MKRKILSLLGLIGLLTAPAAFAQSTTHSPYQQSVYYAADYGQWAIQSQTANTYLFSPQGLCTASASGTQFFPFNTNAPVYIVDATPANSEVVTPGTVTNNSAQCGFTASPSNSHTSFQVKSGTAGLQEAINVLAVPTTAYPALIVLDRNWYTVANSIVGKTGLGIIGATTGNTHALLQDITTASPLYYVFNGTTYVAGTWSNVAPTAAAGAGAGTSPTITDSGTALVGTVSLTSGTATTTGTLFTLAWATSAQFLAAPTGCTVKSIGTNPYTTFTTATSFGSSHATLTVTVATTAPVASTAYKFSYSCY